VTVPATRTILQGGIIAAGEGSRLRRDGSLCSKPMVQVCGRPLIEHAVARLVAAGISRLTIIINESSEDCRQWLNHHSGDFELDLIIRSTPSSFASFQAVASRLAGAPALITTVDSIMPTADFRAFVAAAAGFPTDAIVLGLTDFVDDESPLWATLDPASGRIRQLGGSSGSHVTAGLYVLPGQRLAEPAAHFARLRDYLGWLIASGYLVYGVGLSHVFDIDRAHDIEAAERASRFAGIGGGA
jgi:NDP-sugar pyrophosphorylase family protein